MPLTNPMTVTSYEEAIEKREIIFEKFKEDSIVVLRDLNLTTEEQAEYVKSMGDFTGWFPNHSSDFNQRYRENHERTYNKELAGPDAVVVPWHLEHVDFDTHTPIIAGVWNMLKFDADPDSGKTYFVDTAKMYKNLTDEEQDFLSKSLVEWYETDGSGPFYTPAVQPHWVTGEPVIRIDIRTVVSSPEMLYEYDGRKPTEEEKQEFVRLRNFYMDEIRLNEDIRLVHKWKKGDLVIVDLFKNAHAVTGGFSSEDREFTGEWVYPKFPETREFLDFIDNIVAKRADGAEKVGMNNGAN